MDELEKTHQTRKDFLNAVDDWIDSHNFWYDARENWAMYNNGCMIANVCKDFYFKDACVQIDVQVLYKYYEVHDYYEPVDYELYDLTVYYEDSTEKQLSTNDMYALEKCINEKI